MFGVVLFGDTGNGVLLGRYLGLLFILLLTVLGVLQGHNLLKLGKKRNTSHSGISIFY